MTNRIPENYGKKEKKVFLSLKKKKKKKNKNTKEEDRIFQLMPSKTGHVLESTFPKTLKQLTEEALAMKNHLESHPMLNAKLSEFLMYSLGYVIRMVTRYCKETKIPPFNWKTRKFPKKFTRRRLKMSSQDVEDNRCNSAENAFKLSECSRVLADYDFHGIAQVNSVSGSETVKAYGMHFKIKQTDVYSIRDVGGYRGPKLF